MKNPRCTPRPARSWFASDRKSTRLNSSHSQISYAVFCLKKNKNRMLFLPFRVTHLLRRPPVVPLACARLSGHVTLVCLDLSPRRSVVYLVRFHRPLTFLC